MILAAALLALALSAGEPDRRSQLSIGQVTVRRHSPLRPSPLARFHKKKRARKHSAPPPVLPTEPLRPATPLEEVPKQESREPAVETTPPDEDETTTSVEENGPAATFDFSGFLMGRLLLVNNRLAPLSRLLPGVGPRAYFEANVQPRLRLPNDVFGVSVDATLYAATSAPTGLLLINEAYLESTLGPVYLLVGRRRIIWGSGLAVNPTDILNPLKNPLDVEQQRVGALLLPLAEVALKRFAFSALYSPGVLTNSWALPNHVDFRRSTLALRGYASWLNADWNLIYLHQFEARRDHLGLSFSRFFGDMLELHTEVRARTGHPEGVALPHPPGCGFPPGPGTRFTATALAGGRLEWPDQTFVSLEYLYWGDGLNPRDYEATRAALPCLSDAFGGAPLPPSNPVGHPLDLPFILFRRHYAFAIFQRKHLASAKYLENVSIGLNVTVGLEDLSAVAQAVVGYSFGGTAAVRLSGVWWAPGGVGQFALLPARSALYADVRVFF